MKVMFVVTHLLGSGHLSRTLTLAQAFQSAGHETIVVSGGMPIPHLHNEGLTLIQLPPLRSDGIDFTQLLDQNGALAKADLFDARKAQLIECLNDFAPDALITELFPFGRRILRDEFYALLEAAHAQAYAPLILSSIRDILAPPSKPKKAIFAQDSITRYYDGVLVHSDPSLMPLDLSWPVDDLLRPSLRYTGFVAPALAHAPETTIGKGEIIVSAGGGDVGDALFDCAKAAAATTPDRVWRLLIGGGNSDQRIQSLSRDATPNLIVEPARREFRQMLHHAAASVSMCGYNTAQDVLQTSCPAVFVPFDAGQEVEQSIRAKALGTLAGIEVITSAELTPTLLLAKVRAAVSTPPRSAQRSPSGAAQTVKIVEELRARGR